MGALKEISNLEQAYYQLEKIKKQVDSLSDFLASKLRDTHIQKPHTQGMIDRGRGKANYIP